MAVPFPVGAGVLVCAMAAAAAHADLKGSVFLTGHDPDFHAVQGGNTGGAQKLIQVGVDFVMDPEFNVYSEAGITKFLFVESKISPPGGHINGVNGMIAAGYTPGVHFDHHDASTLESAIALLGVEYAAIMVASDFGGVLTQAELDLLNANSDALINFVNSGGGLFAMAESNNGSHLTPDGGHFGFLPFIVTGISFDQNEQGFTVTDFGASLGLTDADVNGNASHNFFEAAFGLKVVNVDAAGRIMTLADHGPIPTPATGAVLALAGVLARRRRR